MRLAGYKACPNLSGMKPSFAEAFFFKGSADAKASGNAVAAAAPAAPILRNYLLSI